MDPSPAALPGAARQVWKSHSMAHALVLFRWADGDRQRLSPGARAAIEKESEAAGRPGGSPGLLASHPADRFLVAQARALSIPLLRAASKIRSYGHVRSLW